MLELLNAYHLRFIRFFLFVEKPPEEVHKIFGNVASNVDSYRHTFEYIQDYSGIHGLRMWHAELLRISNHNVEQECSRYLK